MEQDSAGSTSCDLDLTLKQMAGTSREATEPADIATKPGGN
jgi:hypothetical protein